MNNFFTALTGFVRLSKAFFKVRMLQYQACDAPQGRLSLKTCWGASRYFFFSFREFQMVDGRYWTPYSLEKFLGLSSSVPIRIFVVVSRGKVLFFYKHCGLWSFATSKGVSFHNFTEFLACPRRHEIEPTPFSRKEAIDLQRYLEKVRFGNPSNAESAPKTQGGV